MQANVSYSLDWMGRLVTHFPNGWKALGRLESKLLAFDLEKIAITSPIFICGLARAGSTILLETLATLPGVATHRYQDFPFLFTPYWWNMALGVIPFRKAKKTERAHGDSIEVSPESPEAMEEMLWMAFFEHLHNTQHSAVLDIKTQNAAFADFYKGHIKKLLLVRRGNRYLSKGNYNITRMEYLLSLFPDARFIIPIRDPVTHIASLMRQHQRFCEMGKTSPAAIRHMNQVGHFEFGPNRIPIHTGDESKIQAVLEAWNKGEEVKGWALYWGMLYGFIYAQLQSNASLKQASMIVPFEGLCHNPGIMLESLLAHCQLPENGRWLENASAPIKEPSYYSAGFSDDETRIIRDITERTVENIQKMVSSAGIEPATT